ncbi:MAG: SRPBCC family protein [Bacteroidia bacterium]
MIYTIKTKQFLRANIDTVWKFMSSPKNLAKITPSYMGFHILTDEEDIKTAYQGQIIEYKVSPVLGIKMHWVTEITHLVDKKYFVDEQRFGPYSFWHHQHFIKEVEGGVEMIDIVHYKLPFGILGRIANALFVKKQLAEIFNYRYEKLEALYNNKFK